MLNFFISNTFLSSILVLCLFVTKNSHASTYFIEPEFAITHSPIGNNKNPQSSLIDKSIDPYDKASSSEIRHSELDNSSSLGLSTGVKIQRLEFRFSYLEFGESTSSSKVNKFKYSISPGFSLKKEIDNASEMGISTTRTASARSYAISYHNQIDNYFSWKPSFGILSWTIKDKSRAYSKGSYEEVKLNESNKIQGHNIFFSLSGSYTINKNFTVSFNSNRYLFGASSVISTGVSLRGYF